MTWWLIQLFVCEKFTYFGNTNFSLFESTYMQGLYGQGKSGENISFSRWSGKVRESQGKSGNSTKKSGKSWKKSGRFFWKVLISYESRSIVYFSNCVSNKLLLVDIILFVYILKVREKVCFAGLGHGKT